MKNCPNCGAPIDYELQKCSYCGTLYYDLSSMSLEEPFFLRLTIHGVETIIALCRLDDLTIEMGKDCLTTIQMNLSCLEPNKREKRGKEYD